MAGTVVLVSNDWMMRPRIEAAALASGWKFASASDLATIKSTCTTKPKCPTSADDSCFVLVDLPAVAKLDAEQIATLKHSVPSVRIIAFGPHVQTAGLERAKQIGCDEVWTNGQLQNAIAGGTFPAG